MEAQASLQRLLQTRFSELQTRNPSFSMRAFSRKLGLSPSATSELLRGQRRASRKLAEKIAEKLLLDPQETYELLKRFPLPVKYRNVIENSNVEMDHIKLSADQFQLIADWVHYAILSLVKTVDFQSDPEWIASRLGVQANKVSACIERLERLEMIKKDEMGKWKRAVPKINTPDDILNPSIQKAHISDMEIAKTALIDMPVEFRDFTSISMPTSLTLLPKAKLAIRKFNDEIARLLETEASTEVYQMSVYLYPLTQVKSQAPGVYS